MIITATLIVALMWSLYAAAAPPPHPGCVAELVAFSPCLPYVSAPPNNLTDTVAPECCHALSSTFDSGDGYCLCYLLRQPLIFGFSLNESRLLSLSSFCLANSGHSIDFLCSSGAPALPPLRSTAESEISKPSDSQSVSAPIPSGSWLGSAVRSPSQQSSEVEQIVSFAIKRIYNSNNWFAGILIFLVDYIHM